MCFMCQHSIQKSSGHEETERQERLLIDYEIYMGTLHEARNVYHQNLVLLLSIYMFSHIYIPIYGLRLTLQ